MNLDINEYFNAGNKLENTMKKHFDKNDQPVEIKEDQQLQDRAETLTNILDNSLKDIINNNNE